MAGFKRDISGQIVHAGAEYEWPLHCELQWCTVDGWKGMALTVRRATRNHMGLAVFDDGNQKCAAQTNISPAMVENGIAAALQAGWEPLPRRRPIAVDIE